MDLWRIDPVIILPSRFAIFWEKKIILAIDKYINWHFSSTDKIFFFAPDLGEYISINQNILLNKYILQGGQSEYGDVAKVFHFYYLMSSLTEGSKYFL